MEHPPTKPSRRNLLVLAGGALALLAGLIIGWALLASGGGGRSAPPASQAGLIIDSSGAEGDRIDPAKPLRCFVAGQSVGEFSLAECAKRNGVATDALDVGIDETGALAAAQQESAMLTPLPPEAAPAEPVDGVQTPAEPDPQPTSAACWKYGGGQWRRLPADMDLNACVQALFSGRCERPGHASYGRWGPQTLRLVAGKVEISGDNQNFRLLASQGQGCSIPTAG